MENRVLAKAASEAAVRVVAAQLHPLAHTLDRLGLSQQGRRICQTLLALPSHSSSSSPPFLTFLPPPPNSSPSSSPIPRPPALSCFALWRVQCRAACHIMHDRPAEFIAASASQEDQTAGELQVCSCRPAVHLPPSTLLSAEIIHNKSWSQGLGFGCFADAAAWAAGGLEEQPDPRRAAESPSAGRPAGWWAVRYPALDLIILRDSENFLKTTYNFKKH